MSSADAPPTATARAMRLLATGVRQLRVRALVFFLALLLPALAVLWHLSRDTRELALENAFSRLQLTVKEMATLQRAEFAFAEHLVNTALRLPPGESCSKTLEAMVAHDRRIANLFVASADGRVLCSADQRQSARVDDRPDFQRALAATQLVIGTVTQSRGTGRPVVPFLLARRAAAGGTVEAVAVATVEVEAVLAEVKPLLDPGARIVYVDEDGLILLRWPDPGDWTGRNIAASDVFRAMQALGGEGSTLAHGVAGERRVFSFTPLANLGGRQVTVWLSTPSDAVTAAVDAQFQRLLLLAGGSILLAALLYWFAARRLLMAPVARLRETAQRIGAGDLAARTGLPHDATEFGGLAQNIDGMAAALGAMQETVRATRALKTRLAQKALRADETDERMLLAAYCRAAVESGQYSGAWVGYAGDDAEQNIVPMAWAGVDRDAVMAFRATWADRERGRGPIAIAIREQRTVLAQDIGAVSSLAPWKELIERLRIRAALALPLRADGAVFGAIVLYATETNAFGTTEVELLEEMAVDMGNAVAALRERAARRAAELRAEAQAVQLADAQRIARVGSWELDHTTGRAIASDEMLRIAGVAREDFDGSSGAILALTHPEDRTRLQHEFREALRHRSALQTSHRLRRDDGSVRMVEVRAQNVYDDAGRPLKTIGTSRDITDEHVLRVELRERMKELRCLYEVFRLTERSDLNLQALLDELVLVLPQGWLHEGDAVARIRFGPLAAAGPDFVESPWTLSAPFKTAAAAGDITIAYRQAHETLEEGPFFAGERHLLDAVARRIAEAIDRRDERARLQEREAVYSAIFRQAHDAIILFDLDNGHVLEFNDAAPAMLGYSAAEFAALRLTDLTTDTPETIAANLARMSETDGAVFATGCRHRDGRLLDVRVSARPVQIGARRCLVSIVADQTALRQTESALQRSNRRLRAVSAALSAIVVAGDEEELLDNVCRAIVETGGYRNAWIGFAQEDDTRTVKPVASAGPGREYPYSIVVTWAETEAGAGPTGLAIRNCRAAVARDILHDPRMRPWRAVAERLGHASSIAVPLLVDAGTHAGGALMVYSEQADAFDAAETALLTELAATVSLGISGLRNKAAREQAGREIELTAERLGRMIEASPVVVYTARLEAGHPVLAEVSDNITRILGRTPAESLAADFRLHHVHPEDRATVEAADARLAAGENVGCEYRLRHADGSWRWLQDELRWTTSAAGAAPSLVGAWTDISARRRTEEMLHKLSQAVAQSPESIVITDLDAHIEYVNDAFLRATGYTREEALGANPKILHSGKTAPAVYDDMWATLTAGRPWKGEFVNKRKDGSEYIELAIIAPIRNAEGRVTHYLAVKDDITERKHMGVELDNYRRNLEELVATRTAELEAAREKADAANLAKSAFLANMSHEIRTPMNAILGYTHLLRSATPTPEQNDRLRKIEASARHLLLLIDDILDLSKVEAGKMTLERVGFDPGRIVSETGEILRTRADEKSIDLEVVLDPTLPAVVTGDPLRLRQILLNLGGNAVKFTASGKVVLRATRVSENATHAMLRFEVSDTGIGISAENLQRLFQPFEQINASTARTFGGTGLGLAISRNFATLMGGELTVDSRPGEGSTFTLTAPFERGGTTASPAPAAPSAVSTRGLRVLLVEDDAMNQEIAAELLRERGYRVDVVGDGAAALTAVAARPYDLVLMDVQMPVMDGLTATRRLRESPVGTSLPVIGLSAGTLSEERVQCLDAGMVDFVAKPFDPAALFATIERWAPPGAAAAPAPSVAAETDTALANVDGLDVAAGLRAVGSRRATWERLLRGFVQTHGSDADAIRSSLAQADPVGALRAAHTLKGLAATVGAVRVSAAAQELETALRGATPNRRHIETLIATLDAATRGLVAQLLVRLPATSGPAAPPPAPPASLGELLDRLGSLLAQDDVRAAAEWQASAPLLRGALGTHAATIEKHLAAFEFDRALAALRAAVGDLGLP